MDLETRYLSISPVPYHAAWAVLSLEDSFPPREDEWASILPLLERHKLLGQAWSFYQKRIPKTVSAPFQTEWKNQWIRNGLMLGELERILRNFTAQDLLCVPLKGAALIDDLYSDRGGRFMSDLDLWFPKREISRAVSVLQSLGGTLREEKTWAANKHKATVEWETPAGPIVLELHDDLLPFEKKENIWRTKPAGSALHHRLLPEDELVYLIGHAGYQHSFQRLFWLSDLLLYFKKYGAQLNWTRVGELLTHYRLHRSFTLTALILERFTGYTLPERASALLVDVPLLTTVLKDAALWEPEKHALRYLSLKHFAKDSAWQSIRYSLLWALKHRED